MTVEVMAAITAIVTGNSRPPSLNFAASSPKNTSSYQRKLTNPPQRVMDWPIH